MNGLGEQANNPSQSIGYSQLNCSADEGGGAGRMGGPDGTAGWDDKLHLVATCVGNRVRTLDFMLLWCFLEAIIYSEDTCRECVLLFQETILIHIHALHTFTPRSCPARPRSWAAPRRSQRRLRALTLELVFQSEAWLCNIHHHTSKF